MNDAVDTCPSVCAVPIQDIAKAELLPHVPALVAAILPWQSKSTQTEDTKLMELSVSANQSLLKLVTEVSTEMLVRERPVDTCLLDLRRSRRGWGSLLGRVDRSMQKRCRRSRVFVLLVCPHILFC